MDVAVAPGGDILVLNTRPAFGFGGQIVHIDAAGQSTVISGGADADGPTDHDPDQVHPGAAGHEGP